MIKILKVVGSYFWTKITSIRRWNREKVKRIHERIRAIVNGVKIRLR